MKTKRLIIKVRKLTIYTLVFAVVFGSLPQNVIAQTITPSATLSPEAPVENQIEQPPAPQDNIDYFSNLTSEDQAVLDALDQTQPSSANLRQPTKLRPFVKKDLKADESATVVVENAKAEELSLKVFDFNGNQVNTDVEIISNADPVVIKIHPAIQNKPGRYRIKVTDSQNQTFTQEFTWGVLAINTNKSIYSPNETASIQMAVLDDTGEMVCNSNMTLKITDPALNTTTLTTESGTIIVNPQCYSKEFTLVPDYQASYETGEEGMYNLELTATTPDGSYTIRDSFEVRGSTPFDMERTGPTRIYPPLSYPVTLKITANQDFTGVVKEYVPASFSVTKNEEEGLRNFDSIETKTADSDKSVLGAQVYNIGKPFAGDYDLSLGFGGQHRDPQVGSKYTQFGVLGHDGVDFALPMDTAVIAVDDGDIVRAKENSDYGTTIVIQHSWGKSYYGHLDKIIKTEGTKVKKGEIIALSGNTGLSSGPHLHFGIKPEKNDFDNGFYGKINPLPFLGIADSGAQHGKVAGVSTSAQAEIKNGVQVISWNVSVKKGEEVTLGYKFDAPDISPELYLLGPAEMQENNVKVFAETRHWQVAADSIVVNGGIVSSEGQFGGLQRKVAYVNSNWYAFYQDSANDCTTSCDVFWKKSSNGITWGSAQNLDANEDNDADNYNPSIDVSGNFIHVFYLDDSGDQVQGLRLDTTSDLTTQTSVCALTSPGAFAVSTYMVSVASLDAASAAVAYSDTSSGTNEGIFKVTALDGASCTVADIQTTVVSGGTSNIQFSSGITDSDRPVLVGLSSTSVAMISQDGNLSYAEFDVTENEWKMNNMTIASVADNIYSSVTNGTKTWVLSDAAADSTDTNFYTLNNAVNTDFAEQSLDADAGANNQDGTSDIDMFCVAADDCKIVYTDDQDVTNTPVLRFIDCNNASCSSSNSRALDSDCGDENIACNPAISCSSGTDCHIVYFDQTTTAAPDAVFIDCDGADNTDACSTNAAVIKNSDLGTSASRSHFDIDCPTGTNCKFVYAFDANNGINFVDCADDECSGAAAGTEVVDYGTSATAPNVAIDCPSSTTCKVVTHDADAGTVVLVDCSTAGTPETCATPPAPDTIESSVGTTAEMVDVDIDCLADGTDCRVIYTNDTSDDLRFVDCNDTDCDAPTEVTIDSNGGASSTVEPNVSLYCVSVSDCKVLYTGALTTDAEKLYFVDCNDGTCSAGSVIETPGPRFRGSVFCPSSGATPSQSEDCKMVYYEGTAGSAPAVVFADCDTTNCYPSVTDDTDPWTSENTVTSVSLTYNSSDTTLIANIVKDATNQQAYYKTSPAGTIGWDTETAYEFDAGAMDNISSPETAAGTSRMGVLVRLGSNIEFDLLACAGCGPTNDQLMRHGKWFQAGVEQPFTF